MAKIQQFDVNSFTFFAAIIMVITVFGDSIAWGAFDEKKGGWVNRFKLHHSDCVYNLGVSGDGSFDLLKRFQVECVARKPNVIIFAIGINDSQYMGTKDKPRTTKIQFENNLIELVQQAKKNTDKIIFVGLTKVDESKTMPIPWAKDKFYDNENVSQYNKIIKKVSQENDVIFIDVFDLLEQVDLADGLHPNTHGHEKIFEVVKKTLGEMFNI